MKLQTDQQAEKVLTVWIAAAGILVVALCSALAGFFTPWLLILSGLGGILTVFFMLWYPRRYVAAMHGSFDGRAIRAVQGVFWKREIFVPLSSLRTFEISATPIQKRFHCRCVTLRFAGGAVWIPLLPDWQADQLERLVEQYDRS